MKITFNWLKQYVDFDWSPEQLAERLTMLGLEVEDVEQVGGNYENIVVAQVLTKDEHPNADKLLLCKVDDGRGERQIVCGATNFKSGDKVALALPGCTFETGAGSPPFKIKVAKIRGVESHGMMCSGKELGLSEDASGLMILPEDAPVGRDFSEYLGPERNDVVYDLEITPNRPDLNSVIGIAREVSALTGNPLKIPEVNLPAMHSPSSTKVEELVDVELDDTELCPRYTARVIKGVKIGPSPEWLRTRLERVGIRSINNVVDVTNFVLFETGHPLHAFDYNLLDNAGNAAPTIVVRRAGDGESFTTLDEQEHRLTSDMLLIADEEKAVALAGIMGGMNSEINEQTTDVLIESAYFKPQNIRATSKALGVSSESSYRFERGADIGICDYASRRAAQLILGTAGGMLAEGLVDAYPVKHEPHEIVLRHERSDRLLGVRIPPKDQVDYMESLGLEVADSSIQGDDPTAEPAATSFRIPSFRVDLKREADLIEEVCRMYGVDRIPSTPPRGAIGTNPFDDVYDLIATVRRILTELGLFEAQGQTLISGDHAYAHTEKVTPLRNPLSSEMDILRPSLLPGLIDALRHNAAHQVFDVALFEIGKAFSMINGKLAERRCLAIAITGARYRPFWKNGQDTEVVDIYDLKGIIEEFLDQFGIRGVRFAKCAEESLPFIESAELSLGKNALGRMGMVSPVISRKNDIKHPVFMAEFDLEGLMPFRNPVRSFKPLPAFPAIRRDVAMVVPESVTHDMVLAVAKKAAPANLKGIELFDVFRGKHIPEGSKSLAYAFTYRHAERTLKDEEVNTEHAKLVQAFKERLDAAIREQ
ncbi:MAG: phenylalanine--tRNA ligase subunit beta [Verrucomicrobia bacterium]|nr:phenylalanine--tRNA ligase subunit beta [Verrucomicrobiota bacterium]MCF7708125.1 phenylalanine--tRNA ligase subunit beta [Verrucomicrobiota bacterium]